MRIRAFVLAAVSLAAGPSAAAASPTLGAILNHPGPDVALVQGTSDYAPGENRVSFLVIRKDGATVNRPTARVWVGDSLDAKPFAQATATLEPVGVPGAHPDAGDVTHLYVVQVRVPRAGKYFIVAEPAGGSPIQAVGNLVVKARTDAPPVGAKAIPSKTPTIASTHGDLKALTTRTPPDTALLRYSVADSLRAHRPFVLVFATPKFCTSRTCGPVVDVVDAVRTQFAKTDIRFIHVEIYEGNEPTKGVNRWVTEWGLPTEPFTFLVGRDGRIKGRFEGSVSAGELAAAVHRNLG